MFIELEELERLEEIKDNVYYLYPSHDVSAGLIVKGNVLKLWLTNETFGEFALLSEAYMPMMEVFSKVYTSEMIQKALQDWDCEYFNFDDFIICGYVFAGKKVERIKYGSEVYNKLNELVQD